MSWNTLGAHRVYVYVCSKRSLPWNSGQVELTRLFRTEQGGLSRGSCSGGLWWRIGTYRPGTMSREDKIQLSRYRCGDKQPRITGFLYAYIYIYTPCHYGLMKRFLREPPFSPPRENEKPFEPSVLSWEGSMTRKISPPLKISLLSNLLKSWNRSTRVNLKFFFLAKLKIKCRRNLNITVQSTRRIPNESNKSINSKLANFPRDGTGDRAIDNCAVNHLRLSS